MSIRPRMASRSDGASQSIKEEMSQLLDVDDVNALKSARSEAMDEMGLAFAQANADGSIADVVVKQYNRSNYWGGWMAFSEMLVTLATIAWFIAIIVFIATNKYNVRFDYNTNYLDRHSCGASGDQVCQEVTFGPMHSVNVSWVSFFTLIAILLAEVATVATVGLYQKSKEVYDMDAVFAPLLAQRDDRNTGIGLFSILVSPFRYLGRSSYNQLTTWYNVRHAILDPALVLLVFVSFGVRGDIKLLLLMGLAALWNFLIAGAQQENYRTAPFRTVLNRLRSIAESNNAVQTRFEDLLRWAEARWLLPILQACVGGFLFALITVYFSKFPYHSRHWYHYFAALVLLINVGLRSLFNLFRYVCYEPRLSKTIPSGVSTFGQGISCLVRTIGSLGGVLCFSPTVIQTVLTLYDILGLFTFWVILHGCEGHANVARIVWPTALSVVY